MGLVLKPEVNLARRVIEKYNLEPPINIKELLSKYAEVIFIEIPFEGADGVSLDLKAPGKKPRVLVNSSKPKLRQRFTMAHELGHILIPWHIGTIIDHADISSNSLTSDYWTIEEEANVFAAELLMPHQYISELLETTANLSEINKLISFNCETSAISAALRLSQFVPRNTVYAYEKGGRVVFSGKTEGTLATTLDWHQPLPTGAYDYCEAHYSEVINNGLIHWWKLPNEVYLEEKDPRPWREILEQILIDISVPEDIFHKTKLSINGIVASANSRCKQSNNHNVETIVAGCIQRFKDREQFNELVEHPLFETFLLKRAKELSANNS